ncbi:hypothetical protein Hanom_Chr08g00712071 [Helianthus anomalus]
MLSLTKKVKLEKVRLPVGYNRGNKKLRAICVRSGIRHRQNSCSSSVCFNSKFSSANFSP